jgi:hypothetical protein
MTSASKLRRTDADTADIVDNALDVSRIASEIAVDLFGMFFLVRAGAAFLQAIA